MKLNEIGARRSKCIYILGNYLAYKTLNIPFLLLNRVGELWTIFKRIISFHRNNFYFNDSRKMIYIYIYKRSKFLNIPRTFSSPLVAIKLVTVPFETFYKSSTSYRRLCERVKGLEPVNRFLHSCSTTIPISRKIFPRSFLSFVFLL